MATGTITRGPEDLTPALTPNPAVPQGSGPTIRVVMQQYWDAAWRRRWLVGAIIALAVAVGLILTMTSPRLFTATSQIEISRQKKSVTNVRGVDQNSGNYDFEYYDTQYNLLRSGSLAERIARHLNLAQDPVFFAAHGVVVPAAGTLSAQERRRREQMAAGLLLGGVKIVPVENSSLVNISYVSRNPGISAKIANAWPKEFIGSTMDREFSSNADARRFLEGLLTDLRARLEQSERDVINFTTNQGIVKLSSSTDAQGRTSAPRTLVESDLETLNAALLAARTDRIAAQSRVGSPPIGEAGGDSTNALRNRRSELAAEYARLMVRFEPGYPAALTLRAQIDALDAAIARESGRGTARQQTAYQQAVQRERTLEVQVATLKSALDAQQRATVQASIYQREADTNRQLYDALLQRYKEVGLAGSVGTSNIAVTDVAKIPGGPSSPNLNRNLIIALLIGIGLAGATVLALEQVDEKVRNPSDITSLLNLPNLGTVPKTDGNPLEDLRIGTSELSEAYFSIRTTLAFATTHGLPRSLVITSSDAGEGKSTSALGLAIAIGRAGKQVLLIDADMRSPSAHHLIGATNERGLSNLLAGEDDSAGLIVGSELKGVDVLPAGPNPPSAAELLGADRLGEILERLQGQYDCLIIDSPPVLGLADAVLLAKAAEGCVFVVESEKTGVSSIRNALNRLREVDARLFGTIVTKIDDRWSGYGYNYQYNYARAKEVPA